MSLSIKKIINPPNKAKTYEKMNDFFIPNNAYIYEPMRIESKPAKPSE